MRDVTTEGTTPCGAPAGALPSEARRSDHGWVGAVWVRARSLLRRRVAGTLVLVALIGLAGAVVLAGVTGARRSDRALPGFLARQHPPDAVVYVANELQGGTGSVSMQAELGALRRLPDVEQAARAAPFVVGGPGARRQFALGAIDPEAESFLGAPIVVDGRRPDPARPDEAAIDEELAERAGAGVGERMRVSLFRAAQAEEAIAGTAVPEGPEIGLEVVGTVRYPHDLVPTRVDEDSDHVDHADLYLTPAFWERHGPDLATVGLGVAVRLADGRQDVDQLRADARRLFGDLTFVDEIDPERGVASVPLDGVRRAVDLETRALQGFAALVAVAAFVLVGQALARQVSAESGDDPVLGAVGMTRRQVVAAAVLRAAVVATGAAVVAMAGAVALSPLTPLGVARRADLSPGVHVDAVVLALGGLGLVVLVCARAAAAAWWATAATGRRAGEGRLPSRGLWRRVAAGPLPLSGRTGLALALQRGRGGRAAPLGGAAAAAVVAVVAVAAAAAFGSSLAALRDEPEGYGATWDLAVGNPASVEQAEADADRLRVDTAVEAFAGLGVEDLLVGEEQLGVSSLVMFDGQGRVPPLVVEGRPPEGPDDLALGGQTMEELGLDVGDTVVVGLQDFEPQPFRVSGQVVLNSAELDDEIDNGVGALLTAAGHRRLAPAEVTEVAQPQSFVVRFARGVDREAAVDRLAEAFPRSLLRPGPPSQVQNVFRVASLPAVLAGVVAVLGTGAAAHAIAGTVRRRRRELAVLSGLGFVRRQVMATLAWVATGFAVVALVVGLPVGVALGRWAWRATADALWVVAPPEVPVWALALVPVAALAVVNATALVTRSATGRRPAAEVLRAES